MLPLMLMLIIICLISLVKTRLYRLHCTYSLLGGEEGGGDAGDRCRMGPLVIT